MKNQKFGITRLRVVATPGVRGTGDIWTIESEELKFVMNGIWESTFKRWMECRRCW